jgi:hypothetical protein
MARKDKDDAADRPPAAADQIESPRLNLAGPPTPALTRAVINQWAMDNDVELILFEPPEHFDEAIVGLVRGYGQELTVLYDEAKVLAAMQATGMSEEDAREWFEFNTVGAYLGETTPRFLIRPWEE